MDKNDSKRILFVGWHDWLSYTENAVYGLVIGLFSLMYAIFIGVVSVIYNVLLSIRRFVLKHKVFSLSLLCVVLSFCWFFTFVSMTNKIRICESQRDSVGYELIKLEQAFEGDTIIICKR